MGTNYYAITDHRPHGNKSDERIHIGKSSGRWCFSLHVFPNEGISTLKDWQAIWNNPNINIIDSYNKPISANEMNEIITERWWKRNKKFSASEFYNSEQEFLQMNDAEWGPKGLLRHRIDGKHCIGHGEGTWDLIIGEFS